MFKDEIEFFKNVYDEMLAEIIADKATEIAFEKLDKAPENFYGQVGAAIPSCYWANQNRFDKDKKLIVLLCQVLGKTAKFLPNEKYELKARFSVAENSKSYFDFPVRKYFENKSANDKKLFKNKFVARNTKFAKSLCSSKNISLDDLLKLVNTCFDLYVDEFFDGFSLFCDLVDLQRDCQKTLGRISCQIYSKINRTEMESENV